MLLEAESDLVEARITMKRPLEYFRDHEICFISHRCACIGHYIASRSSEKACGGPESALRVLKSARSGIIAHIKALRVMKRPQEGL